MHVIIDGVEYVPAKQSIPTANEIAKALVSQWFGSCTDDNLADYRDRLRVVISDSFNEHQGWSIDETLAAITNYMDKQ